jgi:hypothetical protein
MTDDQLFICILFFIALYIAAVYGVLKGRKEADYNEFLRQNR